MNSDIVLNVDFAETFLDFAGVPVPGGHAGPQLRPLLKGKTPADWRTSIYYHYYEYPAVHSVQRHYGVRTERYKLIYFYNDIDEWELYDLEEGPGRAEERLRRSDVRGCREGTDGRAEAAAGPVQRHDGRHGVIFRGSDKGKSKEAESR